MDLERVQKKLNEGVYKSKDDFRVDITKIFDNARTYNQEETIYYKYANQLQNYVKPMLERLKEPQTGGQLDLDSSQLLGGTSRRTRG